MPRSLTRKLRRVHADYTTHSAATKDGVVERLQHHSDPNYAASPTKTPPNLCWRLGHGLLVHGLDITDDCRLDPVSECVTGLIE
jgi:hypothetical protein